MSQLLPSRDQENQMWSRLEAQRSAREAARQTVTPQGAQNLSAMHRAHPTLATGTKVSLAQAGVSPSDPIMGQIVEGDRRVKKKKGFGFHTLGDIVSAGGELIGKPLSLLGDVVDPVAGALAGAAKPVVRTGLMALSAPFEEAGGLLRNVASGLPGRSGEVTAGVGGGAAAGAGIGGGIGAVFGGIGAVPGAAIGGAIGAAVGGVAGLFAPEVEGTPQWASQSQLGMAATKLVQGEKVEAGSGWFANAETGLGQEQRDRAIKAAAVRNKKGEIVGGWTIGRSVADVIAEPGTTPYNLLSGLVDASAAIKLDPASAVLKGRSLSVTKHGRTLKALKKDGMIDGARRTILPEKVTDLLDHSEYGADLKATIAGETSAYRISRMFNGQLDHNPEALMRLARAGTDDEAAEVLRPLLGADAAMAPRTEIGKRRASRLIANLPEDKALKGRQSVEIGNRRIEWDDAAGSIKAVDSFLAMAKVPEAERLQRLDEFIEAMANPSITGRLPALEATATSVKSALIAHGADEATARRLSRLFSGTIEDARLYTAGQITDDALLPGMVINGDGVGLKSPFLYNEFLSHGVTLPDPRELSDAARTIKSLNHPLAKGPVDLADKVFNRWRQAAIARPAYMLRVGADNLARMAAANHTSLLNHPADYIMHLVAQRGGANPESLAGRANRALDRVGVPRAGRMLALTGEPLIDVEIVQGGLNRTRGSELFQVPGVSMRDRARLTVGRDDPELVRTGWRDHELSRLHTDSLARQLARLRRTGNSAAVDDEIPEAASVLKGLRSTEELEAVARGPRSSGQTLWEGYTEHMGVGRGEPGTSRVRRAMTADELEEAAAETPNARKVESFVRRGEGGEPLGVLHVVLDKGDRPIGFHVAVEPGHQRQGIGSALFAEAESVFPGLENVSGAGGLTAEGAAFALARRRKAATVPDAVRTAVADATGRGPNYQSIDELKQSFWDGPLSKLRRDLQQMDETNVVLANRQQSDAYVDQVNQWIDDFTRNDDRLLEYVHRGPNKKGVADNAFTAIDELIGQGNHPAMVVGDRTTRAGGEMKGHLDRFVDAVFDTIAVRPENYLAREPVLAETYWNAVERMFPAMTREDQTWAFKLAGEAKAPKVVQRLKERAKVAFDGETIPRDDVHFIAAHEAADHTKKLLYDAAAKQKWSDATRLIFPFATPWQEALTTWSKLLVENPAAIRRLDQTVQGARGAGFFQKDPQTGEEMFVYPGSAFITKALVGAPIPVRGSAGGLNLFSSNPLMPGAGPLVQIAANALIPDRPDFDYIRNAISPYGRLRTDEGFAESLLPPWFQKFRQFLTSGENDRMFNNTVYDMARYLVSTGEYSIDTPEAQEQTTEAAISMAKRMYLLRTGASLMSPSAPSPQMIAEDKDGRVVTQFALMEEYRALQKDPGEKTRVNGHDIEGVGYENAVAEFLDRYGEGALLLMQPKTKGGAAPLDDTMDWIRENPDLAKRYDQTYQYFAPHSGEFSQTAYERELATGERKPLTPKEAMEAANARVASMLMRAARSKTGTKVSDGERKWLSDVQNALIEEYPGYNPKSFDAGRVPAAIRQLEDALGEPKMAETKNGEAIGLYLEARNKAQQAAEAAGWSGFERAKGARGIRDWLRNVAAAITEETPEFATVWDQLLSHELASDLEETMSA